MFQGGDQRQKLDKLVITRDQDKKRVESTVHGLEENEDYGVEVVAVNEELGTAILNKKSKPNRLLSGGRCQ